MSAGRSAKRTNAEQYLQMRHKRSKYRIELDSVLLARAKEGCFLLRMMSVNSTGDSDVSMRISDQETIS
jgi:hypothetical protein